MKTITDINQIDPNGTYTYADYLTWRFKERIELLWGKIFKMAPAPDTNHQVISGALFTEISIFLKRKTCKVFSAPIDVRLPILNEQGMENTVVQPDICVVCDLDKIDQRGIKGAPDIVVEIVSKNSVKKDLHEKYELYEKTGVKEYWIVQPGDNVLTIYVLEQGKYRPGKQLTLGDIATSSILHGLELDLNEIFQDTLKEPEVEYETKEIRLDP